MPVTGLGEVGTGIAAAVAADPILVPVVVLAVIAAVAFHLVKHGKKAVR